MASSGKHVAYYRVSTARQGRSGLGLEAQKKRLRSISMAATGRSSASSPRSRAASAPIGRTSESSRDVPPARGAACYRPQVMRVLERLDPFEAAA